MKRTPKCDICGKNYPILPWGLPAMVGLQTDKKTLNVCKRCLIKIGAMTDADKEAFLKEKGLL